MLNRIVHHYAFRLRNLGVHTAAVVVASYLRFKNKDTSGHVPDPLSPKLKKSLESSCGKVGTRVNGNIVGCCAEQRASNRLINSFPAVPIKRIKFSDAIRPRTMQKIPMCQNCKSTFR